MTFTEQDLINCFKSKEMTDNKGWVYFVGHPESQAKLIIEWLEMHREGKGKNANGHEYVDLGLPSGRLWATKNVGAAKETDYGMYFAWGGTVGHYEGDRHVFDWIHAPFNNGSSTYDEAHFESIKETVCPKGVLSIDYDAAHIQMGGDWRMPSEDDIEELFAFTTSEWVNNYKGSGVNGRLFTSKSNRNSLFIPASGFCFGSSFLDVGRFISIWSRSSSLDVFYPGRAWYLDGFSRLIRTSHTRRSHGCCVRGVI